MFPSFHRQHTQKEGIVFFYYYYYFGWWVGAWMVQGIIAKIYESMPSFGFSVSGSFKPSVLYGDWNIKMLYV